MDFVGEYLRKKRISKKVSLDKISSELKISKNILQNIENDNFDSTINKIYYLCHVRSYANFLDLNTKEIIEQFNLQTSETVQIIKQIPKPIIQNSFFKPNKFFSLASILIIFLTFYYLFVDIEKSNPDFSIIPDIPENLEPIVEKELVDLAIKDQKKDVNQTSIQIINENVSLSSAIASSKIIDNFLPNQIITLKFIKPTWLQLRDSKDGIVLSQLMNKNDEYTYDLNLKYSLTAGNAGNILVIIDNEIRGKIGDFGEVVDSIVIDSNFNN